LDRYKAKALAKLPAIGYSDAKELTLIPEKPASDEGAAQFEVSPIITAKK